MPDDIDREDIVTAMAEDRCRLVQFRGKRYIEGLTDPHLRPLMKCPCSIKCPFQHSWCF